ncbi:hypothetical protein ACFVRE_42230, partial [Streptomyces sp. NPDC057910]
MAQCTVCGAEVVQRARGPARRTCSSACRQKAHRARRAAEIKALRATAAHRTARPGPPSRNEPAPGPPRDGRPGPELPDAIQEAWQRLAEVVEFAGHQARDGWDTSEISPGIPRSTVQDIALSIRHLADELAEAVLAGA